MDLWGLRLPPRSELLASRAGPPKASIAVKWWEMSDGAYGLDGREVARHGPGLCLGDTWVISGAGPAATDWVKTARP